jgi:hypothetical protein
VKREVTPEFVNMSKEILYPQIQGVTRVRLGPHAGLVEVERVRPCGAVACRLHGGPPFHPFV